MKVTAFVRDDGACGLYRVTQPLGFMAQRSDVELKLIREGDSTVSIEKGLGADVIVVPRPNEENMLKVLLQLQAVGKKIVIDHDDNVFHISPLSPHYEDWGTENVKFRMPDGDEIVLWDENKNLDILGNKVKLLQAERLLRMADMITVTTEGLANFYRQYNDNVAVLPNCINTDIWKSLPSNDGDEIRLFWAGGASHYEDWCLLADVMPGIMEKYPQVKLVLMGTKFDATLKGIDPDRIEFIKWVPTPGYPHKVRALRPTMSVIPLVDNEFNRCKSPIKWLEMAALGVPCVTSNVSPYKEIATESNGIFIENNSEGAWKEGISMLIEDSVLRGSMGGHARRYLDSRYDARKRSKDWYDAYAALLDAKQEAV